MPFRGINSVTAQEAGGSRLIMAQQGRATDYAVPTNAASALAAAQAFTIGTNTTVETDLDRYIKRVYRFSECGYGATSQGIDNPTIGESVDRSRPQAGGTSAEGNLVLINATQGLEPLLQTLTGDKTPTVADVTGPPAALRYTFTPGNVPLPGLSMEIVKGTIPNRAIGVQANTFEVNMSRNELSAMTFGLIGLDSQVNTAATTAADGTAFADITNQIDPADLTGQNFTENPAVGFVGWSAGLFSRSPGQAANPTFEIATNADLTSAITGFTQIPTGRAGILTLVKASAEAGTIQIVGEDASGGALDETLTFTTANPETMATTNAFASITSITPASFTTGTVTITANLPSTTATDERLGGTSARFNYNNNFSLAEDLIGQRGAQRVTRGGNFRELSLNMTLPYSRENLELIADFQRNTSPLGNTDLVIQFKQEVGGGLPDAELTFVIADAALESNPDPAVSSPGEIPNEISLRLLPDVGMNNIISIEYITPANAGIQLQQYS